MQRVSGNVGYEPIQQKEAKKLFLKSWIHDFFVAEKISIKQ